MVSIRSMDSCNSRRFYLGVSVLVWNDTVGQGDGMKRETEDVILGLMMFYIVMLIILGLWWMLFIYMGSEIFDLVLTR